MTTATPIRFVSRSSPNRGLTLVELLVTLILSILVLSMVLPLLHQLLSRHPSTLSSKMAAASSAPWKRALQADLRELVSPSKCGIPVFQLLAPSDTQPYPELVLQTFCRPSGAELNSISRGPSEVRYCLETDSSAGPLALVRYAKGWHDPAAARYVLADHLTGWTVDFHGIAPALKSSETSTTTTVRPGELVIEEGTTVGQTRACFWVPLLESATPPSQEDQSQPVQDQEQSLQATPREGP